MRDHLIAMKSSYDKFNRGGKIGIIRRLVANAFNKKYFLNFNNTFHDLNSR